MSCAQRIRALRSALALAVALPALGAATPLYIELEDGLAVGHGLARSRGDECFLLAPLHVLAPALANPRVGIRVYGVGGALGRAADVRAYGTEEEDVATARVVDNAAGICGAEDDSVRMIGKRPVLISRQKSGLLTLLLVEIRSESDQAIEILPAPGQPGVSAGMSGSLLAVDGEPRGLLGSASTRDAGARVIQLEFITRLVGSWVSPERSDMATVSDALSILRNLADSRPLGDSGQVAAAETLTRTGRSLAGFDLAGLSFAGAALGGAQLAEADLRLADLSNAILSRADLTAASLNFARLDGANLARADLTRAWAPFATAVGARFERATLPRAAWFGALMEGADFRDADLANASFYLTDLTGADFSGADLSNAMFLQSVLTGARFDGATLANTDLSSSVLDPGALGEAQKRGACRRDFFSDGEKRLRIVIKIPSTRFDSGFSYDDLLQKSPDFPVDRKSEADYCRLRPEGTSDRWPTSGDSTSELIRESFTDSYHRDLLAGGRGERIRAAVAGHLEQVRAGLATKSYLAVQGTAAADLAAALAKRMADYRPTGPLWINEENTRLLLEKHLPGWRPRRELSWTERAGMRLGYEELARRNDELAGEHLDSWPSFFPPGTNFRILGDEHGRLFEAWNRKRLSALPDVVTLRQAKNLSWLSAWREWRRAGEPIELTPFFRSQGQYGAGSLDPLFAQLGIEEERVISMNFGAPATLVLPRPRQSYLFELPEEVAIPAGEGPPDFDIFLRLESIEQLEAPGSRGGSLLVVKVTPLYARLGQDGVTFYERRFDG